MATLLAFVILLAPVVLIVLAILKFKGKRVKKWLFIVFGILTALDILILCSTLEAEEETDDPGDVISEEVEQPEVEQEVLEEEDEPEMSVEPKPVEEKETNGPEEAIVLDIYKLLADQESNIEKAKELYENKWIELTGKVVSVEHGEYREATRTFMGKTTHFKYGETRYEINGVTIESALIYWLAVKERFEQADVIVEMDIFLCPNDDQTGYVYYPQNSTITVVAYCASIGEKDIVFTDGRYSE